MSAGNTVIVGAGINGLVCANYLRRAGRNVIVVDRAAKAGGACVSATASVDGVEQQYALGASVLGLMQDFVFEETGLSSRLECFVPEHPKLVHFPNIDEPVWIYRDAAKLDAEFATKCGEQGDVEAFREDEAAVVQFLQEGYANAAPPSVAEAKAVLGDRLTDLWITGTARQLLDHYFTSEYSKVYMAMTVTESGPVSLDAPYSAFNLPLMDSGSVFGGYYGHVRGGIWRITEELDRINSTLGVTTIVDAKVDEVDVAAGRITYSHDGSESRLDFDELVFATDPLTAARLAGEPSALRRSEDVRYRGSSGKLNLMFRNPVRWKDGSNVGDADAAFRFLFAVDNLDEFEQRAQAILDADQHYVPGYMQIYCEGGAMRQIGYDEPFDRLAIFFKNLSLLDGGEVLPDVKQSVCEALFPLIENPEDCVWSRLLTPRDLQTLFHFPGGNLDHTMLTDGQNFFDRQFSDSPQTDFYRLGGLENVYLCGSGTYPCGSVTGTAGYMCSQQMLRD